MTELISIRESAKHVDEEVRMHVWLTDKRSSGKIGQPPYPRNSPGSLHDPYL
ncbi:hypothetical protein ACIA4B_07970 [Lactobacillus delbrueckii subsp. bulgaricus]